MFILLPTRGRVMPTTVRGAITRAWSSRGEQSWAAPDSASCVYTMALTNAAIWRVIRQGWWNDPWFVVRLAAMQVLSPHPWRASFLAKRHHGVDACSAARREVTCHERHGDQHQRRAAQAQHIVGTHPVKEVAEDWRNPHGTKQA
jgi:hypothetical protein